MTWRASLPFSDLIHDSEPLGPDFFGRPSPVVAKELIGCVLVNDGCAGRIVETEAYLGERDGASHAYRGLTPRTAVMFGPPAFIYVYFIYGMYHCMNLVTGKDGVAEAVLLRALEPLCGIERMRTRRPKAKRWEDLASGPGKLTLAMGIGPEYNGAPLKHGSVEVRRLHETIHPQIGISPRVGVKACADWPLRFFERENPCVSRSPLNRSTNEDAEKWMAQWNGDLPWEHPAPGLAGQHRHRREAQKKNR